jgi:hypothetical protein
MVPALLVVAIASASAQETVTVDLSADRGPVTYRASGFLHAMTSTSPSDAFLSPVKGKMFRGAGMFDGTDGLNTYKRVVAQGAAPMYLLSDGWGYGAPWPCDNSDCSSWTTHVANTVNSHRAMGMNFQYDIWNEPDYSQFWGASKDQYQRMWKAAVQTIRAIDPSIIIVGPSTCCADGHGWNSWATDLLVFAKANNVLPDIVSFHELLTPAQLTADVAAAKAYLAANTPSIARISVNEMVDQNSDFLPGRNVKYLAAAERAQVTSASHATWHGAGDSRDLDNLLSLDKLSRHATWYAYQAYANITGTIVGVTAGGTVDGVAGRDATLNQAYSVFGRNAGSGNVTFTFTNISSASYLNGGGQVHARVYALANDNGGGSSGPVQLSNADVAISGNAISLTVPSMGTDDVAIIQLTPGPGGGGGPSPTSLPGTVQAEDFDSGGEGVGYHDTDTTNMGGAYRPNEGVDIKPTTDSGVTGFAVGWAAAGEWLRYTVNVLQAGVYSIGVRTASQGAGGTFHIEFDGVDKTGPLNVPDTGTWNNGTWQTVTKIGVSLKGGQQVVRIVLDSNGASGFVGDFDYLTVGAVAPAPPSGLSATVY